MEQQETKPAPNPLRIVAPGWFIFAGIACGFILGLKGTQMMAVVMFGVFLSDLTYAVFFDQTLGLLINKPSPNLRYIMLACAATALFLSWFLWVR